LRDFLTSPGLKFNAANSFGAHCSVSREAEAFRHHLQLGVYSLIPRCGDRRFVLELTMGFETRLTPLIRKTQPYAKRIAHNAIWVEPQLLAEIEYREKSAEGKVRHPFSKRPLAAAMR
jgi:ATP-dependent DNA ligase